MNKFLVVVGFAFLLSACGGLQTRRGKAPQAGGPFDAESQTQQPSDQEPVADSYERSQRLKPKMALVLGPGAFKTFAYPSFLKALAQSGVQVDEVVGIEWGALSAAFYAINNKPHEAEWKVFKLKKEDIDDSSLFGKGEATKVSKLRKYLRTNLGGTKKLRDTAIPFQCPVLRIDRGTVDWGKRGDLWRRVEICLASPPKFQPIDESAPSLFVLEQVANNLKRKGYGVIIFVNVLGRKDKWPNEDWVGRAYWAEARRAIWKAKSHFTDTIEINTEKFQPFDFKAKTGLKGVGERAGRAAARELVEKYNL